MIHTGQVGKSSLPDRNVISKILLSETKLQVDLSVCGAFQTVIRIQKISQKHHAELANELTL